MKKDLVALTPPMGWNSYDSFGDFTNEADLMRNIDLIHERLQPFGWEYVVTDIAWSRKKDENAWLKTKYPELELDEYGRQVPSPDRFPSAADGKGFKPIADYCHSLGLKFGIHIMRGVASTERCSSLSISSSTSPSTSTAVSSRPGKNPSIMIGKR